MTAGTVGVLSAVSLFAETGEAEVAGGALSIISAFRAAVLFADFSRVAVAGAAAVAVAADTGEAEFPFATFAILDAV